MLNYKIAICFFVIFVAVCYCTGCVTADPLVDTSLAEIEKLRNDYSNLDRERNQLQSDYSELIEREKRYAEDYQQAIDRIGYSIGELEKNSGSISEGLGELSDNNRSACELIEEFISYYRSTEIRNNAGENGAEGTLDLGVDSDSSGGFSLGD